MKKSSGLFPKREVWLGSLKGVLFVVALFYIIRFFRLNLWQMIVFFVLLGAGMFLWQCFRGKQKFSWKHLVFRALRIAVTITILITLLRWLGRYGVIGYIIGLLLIGAWRLWRRRNLFMESVREIETKLFGAPLDKKHWKNGEKPQLPKVVWRKK